MDVNGSSQRGVFRPESSFVLGCGLLAVVFLAMTHPAGPEVEAVFGGLGRDARSASRLRCGRARQSHSRFFDRGVREPKRNSCSGTH